MSKAHTRDCRIMTRALGDSEVLEWNDMDL